MSLTTQAAAVHTTLQAIEIQASGVPHEYLEAHSCRLSNEPVDVKSALDQTLSLL